MYDHRSNPSLMNAILRLKSAVEELEQLGYGVTVEPVAMRPLQMGNSVSFIRVTNRYIRNHLNNYVPLGQEIRNGEQLGCYIIRCDGNRGLPRLNRLPQHYTPAELLREQEQAFNAMLEQFNPQSLQLSETDERIVKEEN